MLNDVILEGSFINNFSHTVFWNLMTLLSAYYALQNQAYTAIVIKILTPIPLKMCHHLWRALNTIRSLVHCDIKQNWARVRFFLTVWSRFPGCTMSCVAPGCKSGYGSDCKLPPGVTKHIFPKDDASRRAWIEAVPRDDWEPSNSSILCSLHFTDDDFQVIKINTEATITENRF